MAPAAVSPLEQVFPTKLTQNGANSNNTAPESSNVDAVLEAAIARYAQKNPQSYHLHLEAIKSMPGGNTRSLLWCSPFPLSMKSGQGSTVTDEDGHT